jgi:hypothetical protein
MPAEEDRFERRDLAMSLVMTLAGILMVAFVVLTFLRGSLVASPLVYVMGGIAGLVVVFVGVNGVVRVLRPTPECPEDRDGDALPP